MAYFLYFSADSAVLTIAFCTSLWLLFGSERPIESELFAYLKK